MEKKIKIMEKEPQFIKRQIPIGTGRESEPKEDLPAVEVDNEVIWVNPDFPELPLDIKEGEPTKLGMFLTPRPREGEKTFDLKVLEGHGRSGLLGRAIFKDTQGRLYRDIDLKGTGFIVGGEVFKVRPRGKESTSGILNLDWAKYAKDMSEKFLRAGIRTERYIALIKLNEIIDEKGKIISIGEAKDRGMINQEEKPVIAVRAFGTKFRIGNVLGRRRKKEEMLADAKKMVVQELGIDDRSFSSDDYLEWFAKTTGENLGLMHKNKWHDIYLNLDNITLDCRFVDLDSVEDFSSEGTREAEEIMLNDYRFLRTNILYLLSSFVEMSISEQELETIFSKAYTKAFGYTPKFLERRF